METINDRLRFLIPKLIGEPNWDKFDKEIGNGRSITLSICGERNQAPGSKYLLKIRKRFPEANVNWLLDGQGDFFLPKKPLVDYVKELELKYEIRDRDARRLETALDMASSRVANFQTVSGCTPVKKIRKLNKNFINKAA